MAKSKQKEWYKRWWAITLFVIVSLIILGSLLPDSNNNSYQTNTKKDSNKPLTLEESLNKVLGNSNLDGFSDRIVSVTENTTEDGKELTILFIGNDNIKNSYVFRGMVMDAIDIGDYVSKNTDADVVYISSSFPLPDRYGNSQFSLIFSVKLTRDSLDKINWDNMYPENLFLATDLYHVENMRTEFSALTDLYCYELCLPKGI